MLGWNEHDDTKFPCTNTRCRESEGPSSLVSYYHLNRNHFTLLSVSSYDFSATPPQQRQTPITGPPAIQQPVTEVLNNFCWTSVKEISLASRSFLLFILQSEAAALGLGECPICNRVFPDTDTLQLHFDDEHPWSTSTSACTVPRVVCVFPAPL